MKLRSFVLGTTNSHENTYMRSAANLVTFAAIMLVLNERNDFFRISKLERKCGFGNTGKYLKKCLRKWLEITLP